MSTPSPHSSLHSRHDRGQRLAGGRRRIAAVLVGLALTVGVASVAAVAADDAAAKAKSKGHHHKHHPKPHKPKPKHHKASAKNVIVMISDGMGYNAMLSGDYFRYGATGEQVYQQWPVHKAMSTYSVGSYDPLQAWGLWDYVKSGFTDSAAAATAMSTGFKTYDAAIGVDLDGKPLYHVSQQAEKLKKSTGVVSTVQWSHATPAGFVAHNVSRNDYAGLASEMINDSATDVIMGAGNPLYDDNGAPKATPGTYDYVGGEVTWNALVNGTAGGDADGDGDADPWTLIQSKFDFQDLADAETTPSRVCGTVRAATTTQQARGGDVTAAPYTVPMNANVPDLATMTEGAINVLDNNRKGFFLMVEGGAIDWAGHANQPGRIIEEQIDFNQAVDAVCRWVESNSSWKETLVIVTADHETGYLWGPGSGPDGSGNGIWKPVLNNGADTLPGMQFNSDNHTNQLVPIFANGAGSEVLAKAANKTDTVRGKYLDNTAIAETVFSVLR